MRESGTRESRVEEQWHQGLMHASVTFTVSLCLKAQASPLPSTACRSIKQCSAPIHHHTRVTVPSSSMGFSLSLRRILRAGNSPIILQTLFNPAYTSAGCQASCVQLDSPQGKTFATNQTRICPSNRLGLEQVTSDA